MARFEIINEVSNGKISNWKLCFQYGVYHYDDNTTDEGFRFIWRRPDGSLQAARGQARIPDKLSIDKLLELAELEGWYK